MSCRYDSSVKIRMKHCLSGLLFLLLTSCASKTLTHAEVNARPEQAYLAISTSSNDGNNESLELLDSDGKERQLATSGGALKLADEDFYFFALDPSKTYAFTSARNGNYPTKIDGGRLRQIRLEAGAITYVGSFMLWGSEGEFYSDVILTEAKSGSGAGEELKRAFPKRKIRFGFKN